MKMIQIRNVPDDLHRSLKERAAREGTTMSELILGELPRLARRPSPEQLLERIERRAAVPGDDAADLIRAERHGR
jgi:antitoxin FitA